MNNTPDRALMQEALDALELMLDRFLDTEGNHGQWEYEAKDAANSAAAKLTARLEQPDAQPVAIPAELSALKAVGPDGLPPLPEPEGYSDPSYGSFRCYSADQMQAYARVAIAAQKP